MREICKHVYNVRLLNYTVTLPAGTDQGMVVGVQDMGVGVEVEPDPSY
jgi:hypothetical protein